MGSNQIKMPREHPILRNIAYCIICIGILTPLIIYLLGIGASWLNNMDKDKTEESIAQIVSYRVDTSSNGDSLWYYTDISYNINNKNYEKTLKTRYFVAEVGEIIKIYYEKGNPASASATKDTYNITLLDKLKIFKLSSVLCIVVFTFKAFSDAKIYRERKYQYTNMQQMNNIVNQNNFNNTIK